MIPSLLANLTYMPLTTYAKIWKIRNTFSQLVPILTLLVHSTFCFVFCNFFLASICNNIYKWSNVTKGIRMVMKISWKKKKSEKMFTSKINLVFPRKKTRRVICHLANLRSWRRSRRNGRGPNKLLIEGLQLLANIWWQRILFASNERRLLATSR